MPSVVRKLPLPEFEKVAVRHLLGDNPANYPTELMGLLFKQHMFLSDHSVTVQVLGQEESTGYLYGVFLVRPPSGGLPPGALGGEVQPIRVPIVVEKHRAFPFDVFIDQDGKFYPLTQSRVTSALFQASPYRAVSRESVPFQQGQPETGFTQDEPTSFGRQRGGVVKEGSALGLSRTLLDVVLDRVPAGVSTTWLDRANQDPALRASARSFPKFARAVVKVAEAKGLPQPEQETTEPICAVLSNDPRNGRYALSTIEVTKTGGAVYHSRALPREEAEQFPRDLRTAVLRDGYALVGSGSDTALPLPTVDDAASQMQKVAAVTDAGVYAVMPKIGMKVEATRAVVIPNVQRLDGSQSGMCLVIGEPGVGYQEKVAGIRCGDVDLAALTPQAPRGTGFFLLGDTATEPFTVRLDAVNQAGDVDLYVDHGLGERTLLKLADVRKPIAYGEHSYLFPRDAVFVPLTAGDVNYEDDPARMRKLAAGGELLKTFSVRQGATSGYLFTAPDGKTYPHANVGEIDAQAAGLLLLAHGDTPAGAAEKLAAVDSGRKVRYVARRVLEFRDARAGAADHDSTESWLGSDGVQLAKEAAVMPNQDTVDAVLALGFVTPENLSRYVDCLPDFETAVSKLAEILVGARLGVQDVPESAVNTAMLGMEKVITGLKKLQIRVSLPTKEEEGA